MVQFETISESIQGNQLMIHPLGNWVTGVRHGFAPHVMYSNPARDLPGARVCGYHVCAQRYSLVGSSTTGKPSS